MDRIKIISDSQAHSINKYKNIRIKVMKCGANIYFNQQCLVRKVIPKYAKLHVPNTSQAALMTKRNIHITRIKDEIRFLHKRKHKLKEDLCNTHLEAAYEWGSLWNPIMESILATVKQEANKKYRTINEKLNLLSKTQNNTPENQIQFYPRVINNTNITFSNDEIALLNKGLLTGLKLMITKLGHYRKMGAQDLSTPTYCVHMTSVILGRQLLVKFLKYKITFFNCPIQQ
jgi:hypothetical protein